MSDGIDSIQRRWPLGSRSAASRSAGRTTRLRLRPALCLVATFFVFVTLFGACGSAGVGINQSTSDGTMDETIYAAVLSTRKHQLSGENPTVGVFYSRDGGSAWEHTGWPQGRTFAVTAVPGSGGDTLFSAAGNGLMRTTDGGNSWRITTGWRVTEVQDVTVSPHRPAAVFAGTPYGLFYSDDLGDHWEERSEGLNSRFVASVRVDRAAPGRVFAGTESGLYTSEDGGLRWESTGLDDPIRSIRQSPADSSRWAAALQNRGVAVSGDGGRTWRYCEGAVDGLTIYESEFHPVDPDVLFAGGWETGVLRSDDFGRTWSRFTAGLDGLARNVHSLAISRSRPGFVFAGTMGGGLHLSRDDGESWQPVAPEIFDLAQVWDLFVEGEQ